MTYDNSINSSLTRRGLLHAGIGAAACSSVEAEAQLNIEMQRYTPDHLEYLTRDSDFGIVERGTPIPYKQPEAKLREIGMTRETWALEVVPDLPTGTKMDR